MQDGMDDGHRQMRGSADNQVFPLQLPNNSYNWVETIFHNHSHFTKFADKVSPIKTIWASTIQASSLDTAFYVVTAADLCPVTPGNFMVK
jgi:hypothetical protein